MEKDIINNPLESYEKEDLYTLYGKKLPFYTLGNVIPSEHINSLSKDLENYGIEVIVYDLDGQFTASETELTSVITLVLQSAVLGPIISATGHSATWDIIKYFTKLSWSKVKGQKYTRHYSNRTEEKDITISIQARINNNDYSFNLSDIKYEEHVEIALEKILDFYREQTELQNWKTHFGKFNNDIHEWEMKELKEIIKDKIEKKE